MAIKDHCAIKLQLESEKQELTSISDAELVMNNFMKKLNNGDLTRDTEPIIGEELKMDDEFVNERLESYKKLLESPIIKEVHDPVFVKK